MSRTLRSRFCERTGLAVCVASPLLPWIVRHGSWLLERYQVSEGGVSPYRAIRGRDYAGSIVEFGECVWVLDPVLAKRKLAERTMSGIFVGKCHRSDASLVHVQGGVRRFRTIRRKPGAVRWDKLLLASFNAVP